MKGATEPRFTYYKKRTLGALNRTLLLVSRSAKKFFLSLPMYIMGRDNDNNSRTDRTATRTTTWGLIYKYHTKCNQNSISTTYPKSNLLGVSKGNKNKRATTRTDTQEIRGRP